MLRRIEPVRHRSSGFRIRRELARPLPDAEELRVRATLTLRARLVGASLGKKGCSPDGSLSLRPQGSHSEQTGSRQLPGGRP